MWLLTVREVIMNLLIVGGASQSGTTSIFEYLSSFKGVNPSKVKELDFFLSEEQKGDTKDFIDDYVKKFNISDACNWYLDSSPAYLRHANKVSARLKKLKDDGHNIKLLFILREPEDRLYASYRKWRNESVYVNKLSYSDFVLIIKNDIPEDLSLSTNIPIEFINEVKARAHVGNYSEYISQFCDVLGEDSVALYSFSEVIKNTNKFGLDVSKFCGTPFIHKTIDMKKTNANARVSNIIIHNMAKKMYHSVEFILRKYPNIRQYLSKLYFKLNSKEWNKSIAHRDISKDIYTESVSDITNRYKTFYRNIK
jgi:hypothetical protein